MTSPDPTSRLQPPWDDDSWLEPRDTEWRRGCRWLQSWWRESVLELPPGHYRPPSPGKPPKRTRPVASTLPLDVGWSENYLTTEARRAAERLVSTHAGGLVDEDRLRRNLLSSQPACVNLFAPLVDHPHVIAGWLRDAVPRLPEDLAVQSIEFEWAPPPEAHFRGGSAFDAFITYRAGDRRGFVGVETKYAEDLAAQAPKRVRDVYVEYTRSKPWWHTDAEHRLMAPVARQLWLNVLLAQSLVDRSEDFDEGASVVLTCRDDRAALEATVTVACEVLDDTSEAAAISPQWSTFEDVLTASEGVSELDEWRSLFRRRYLDFSPVSHKLKSDDPRGHPSTDLGSQVVAELQARVGLARAVAERVVGAASILERGAADPRPPSSVVDVLVTMRRLDVAIDALKGARVRGTRGLGPSDID